MRCETHAGTAKKLGLDRARTSGTLSHMGRAMAFVTLIATTVACDDAGSIVPTTGDSGPITTIDATSTFPLIDAAPPDGAVEDTLPPLVFPGTIAWGDAKLGIVDPNSGAPPGWFYDIGAMSPVRAGGSTTVLIPGTQTLQLFPPQGPAYPQFSNDGTEILFENILMCLVGNAGDPWSESRSLKVAARDGSNVRTIASCTACVAVGYVGGDVVFLDGSGFASAVMRAPSSGVPDGGSAMSWLAAPPNCAFGAAAASEDETVIVTYVTSFTSPCTAPGILCHSGGFIVARQSAFGAGGE